MIYTDLTKKALRISFEQHKNQVDKTGIPYVYHPYELATKMDSEEEVCVALLHDVVEDTDMTIEQLRNEGFGEGILAAIQCMTHDDNVPYLEYVREIKKNPIATKVKLADLRHNSTISKLDQITQKDLDRIEKYKKAIEILTDNTK